MLSIIVLWVFSSLSPTCFPDVCLCDRRIYFFPGKHGECHVLVIPPHLPLFFRDITVIMFVVCIINTCILILGGVGVDDEILE